MSTHEKPGAQRTYSLDDPSRHARSAQDRGNSFEFPWSEEDFIRCLRQRNCIGMVAEHDEQVVGIHDL